MTARSAPRSRSWPTPFLGAPTKAKADEPEADDKPAVGGYRRKAG